MDIGQKAARGFFSLLTRNLIARGMGLLAMIVLARKLSPSDFGLVSITEVLLNFIAVFGVTGVFEFLVSYRGEDRDEVNQAAFWFNILMGLVVVLLLNFAAPFWAVHYGDPRITVLAYLVSGNFLLSCLQILPKSMLSQRLDFEAQTRIQAPFILLIPMGKIACAYLGLGVYSLLIPTLAFGLFQTLLFYSAVQWNFQFALGLHRWREIYQFTRHLIGTTFLTRLTDEGDKFLVGKFLGLEALGVYNLASQLAQLFSSNIGTITNQIFAATFPKYAHDKALMLQRYLLVTKVIAFFSFPILCGMAVAAEPLILLIYTEKWRAAIIPFQILTVFALFRSITSSYGAVINALLVPQISFYPLLVYAPIHLLLSVFCVQYGLVALAFGVVALKLGYLQFRIYQIARLLYSSSRQYYANLSALFLASGMACLTGLMVVICNIPNPILELFSIGLVFSATFWISLKYVGRSDLLAIRDFFLKTKPGFGKAFERVFGLKPLPIG